MTIFCFSISRVSTITFLSFSGDQEKRFIFVEFSIGQSTIQCSKMVSYFTVKILHLQPCMWVLNFMVCELITYELKEKFVRTFNYEPTQFKLGSKFLIFVHIWIRTSMFQQHNYSVNALSYNLCRSTTISVVELQWVSQGNSDSGREWLRLPTASLTIVFYSSSLCLTLVTSGVKTTINHRAANNKHFKRYWLKWNPE